MLRSIGPRAARGLAACICAWLVGCAEPVEIDLAGPTADWPEWGATKGGLRFSPLDQITPQNVDRLEIAWTYRTDHFRPGAPYVVFQNTPLVVDDTMYLCTPYNEVIALDPETGRERWRHDPGISADGAYVINCRGVSSWLDPRAAPGAPCRRRLVMGTIDARLIELDARTGKRCAGFGDDGDRIVTGAMVLDDVRVDIAGGVVRAFDVRTGELRWGWDPIPPSRPALAPGPDGQPRYERGTSNAWTALSADPERRLVFVPTGNTSPDYYGGHRQGLDHYSSSVVALDANSGEVVWHFRTVHHDIWDYDVPAQPVLFDFPRGGRTIPAVAVPTKMGHLFFLNRETGEPLFPVEERPVPQEGAVEGEYLSPTQPFPTRPPPLHPTELRPEDAFGFTFWDRGKCREKIESLRNDGIFTPPSTEGSIHYPGMVGGMNWGSVTVDPGRQLMVANLLRVATEVRLIPREEFTAMFGGEMPAPPWEPQLGTPFGLYRIPLLSPFGAPCNPPPWGTLVGIDIPSGEVRWEVPLGTTRDQAPWPLWFDYGAPNLGGSIATGSGLVFIGATTDRYLRAFDTETGEELWRGRLPHAGHATPVTYRLRPDGRQFVAIAAGGHQLLGSEPGDAIVAFALPD